jgi:biotin-dependent carboxylase-like uncharacterized protein
MAIEVVKPGLSTSVQDLGRPGYYHLGIPLSGGMDQYAVIAANLLVGNAEGDAVLEAVFMGPELRFTAAALVAVTGAGLPPKLDGVEQPGWTAFRVKPGQVLSFGFLKSGARAYIAVSGGIDVPPVLGSRSADRLSGLGPPPLRPGDRLPVGRARSLIRQAPDHRQGSSVPAAGTDPVWLRVIAGPRDDWFAPGALRTLATESYQVTPSSGRTGVRLAGPALVRADGRPGELPSEGVAGGSLQVTHDGQPILLLADHPTTGGYPVLAVVVTADLGVAAQLRPGQRVRFTVGMAGQP